LYPLFVSSREAEKSPSFWEKRDPHKLVLECTMLAPEFAEQLEHQIVLLHNSLQHTASDIQHSTVETLTTPSTTTGAITTVPAVRQMSSHANLDRLGQIVNDLQQVVDEILSVSSIAHPKWPETKVTPTFASFYINSTLSCL
jgi:hypothetical protein